MNMKYALILTDGMADEPQKALGGKTPMEAARTPNMDRLAESGEVMELFTIPDSLPAGSDVGNLSIVGLDPVQYYSGRSPLEALSMRVPMEPGDVTYRINLVTLSDEEPYEEKTMVDYSGGEISTEEAAQLVAAVREKLQNDRYQYYAGVSYRHILLQKGGEMRDDFTPPHDISGKKIGEYLPKNPEILDIMKKSYEILKNHPVNQARIAAGKRPANSLWAWGAGRPAQYPPFKQGLRGAMISAVDLLRGIALGMKMDVLFVEGATGNKDTNFAGKGQAAIESLLVNQYDFVYVHIEATDECGHAGDLEGKVWSIEQIDEKIVGPIAEALEKSGEPYTIIITPDHPTPVRVKTHTRDGVPCLVYRSDRPVAHPDGVEFSERWAHEHGRHLRGCDMLPEVLAAN